jgi:hypothetical protein
MSTWTLIARLLPALRGEGAPKGRMRGPPAPRRPALIGTRVFPFRYFAPAYSLSTTSKPSNSGGPR